MDFIPGIWALPKNIGWTLVRPIGKMQTPLNRFLLRPGNAIAEKIFEIQNL